MIAGFDWDPGNREKCGKHGVPAVAMFRDPAHSGDEERFKGIGKMDSGRSALIVFTLRQRAGDAKKIASFEKAVAKVEQR
jgi:hypothetical protein